jgi:spermidine/putrescine transport system permease protein
MSQRNLTAYILMIPATVWLLAFMVIPMLAIALFSLRPDMQGSLFSLSWTPTIKQYQQVVGGSAYLPSLWVSTQVAIWVSLIATLLAYPLAYFLVFRAGARGPLYLTLAILPFWTSYLLRIIAWKIILGSDGPINASLSSVGIIKDTVPLLLYSREAVIVTLVYVWLPFVSLPIYTALLRIDRSLLEAAANLGAPPWLAFLRVTLPLSMPGVIAGFVMVFIPTVGEYVAPILVGGTSRLFGNAIQDAFGSGINWPLGSALSVTMLVEVLVLLIVILRVVNIRQFVE